MRIDARWALGAGGGRCAPGRCSPGRARPVIAVLPFENSGSYGQDKENLRRPGARPPGDARRRAGRASRRRGWRTAGESGRRWTSARARTRPAGSTPRPPPRSARRPAPLCGHRQLRRLLRQVPDQRPGGGRRDGRDPQGRVQRRPQAAGPRPARARIIQLVASGSWRPSGCRRCRPTPRRGDGRCRPRRSPSSVGACCIEARATRPRRRSLPACADRLSRLPRGPGRAAASRRRRAR